MVRDDAGVFPLGGAQHCNQLISFVFVQWHTKC